MIRLKPTRLLALCVAIGALVCIGGLVAYSILHRIEKSWTIQTRIGEENARVDITWSYRPGIMIGPQYLIRRGGDRYAVAVNIDGGKHIEFLADREPRAIWNLNDTYYVACRSPGKDWLLAELNQLGDLIPVQKKDLPPSKLVWNLVPEESQAEYESDFDLWAQ